MDKAITWLVCRLFYGHVMSQFGLEDKVCHCLSGADLPMLIYG